MIKVDTLDKYNVLEYLKLLVIEIEKEVRRPQLYRHIKPTDYSIFHRIA